MNQIYQLSINSLSFRWSWINTEKVSWAPEKNTETLTSDLLLGFCGLWIKLIIILQSVMKFSELKVLRYYYKMLIFLVLTTIKGTINFQRYQQYFTFVIWINLQIVWCRCAFSYDCNFQGINFKFCNFISWF